MYLKKQENFEIAHIELTHFSTIGAGQVRENLRYIGTGGIPLHSTCGEIEGRGFERSTA